VLAAARRFLLIVVGIAGATALVSLLLGLALGAGADRAVSVGLYLVGSFLLIAGFFIGNRGPARLKDEAGTSLLGPRFLRWATPDERIRTINESAIFVTIGLVLLLLGLVVDSRVRLY